MKKIIYAPFQKFFTQPKLDYDFVLKKLGFSNKEFTTYINTLGQPHSNFDTEAKYWERNKVKSL